MSPRNITVNSQSARWQSCARALDDAALEVAVITAPEDITYLTGIWPLSSLEREAVVVLTKSQPVLLISSLRATPHLDDEWKVTPLSLLGIETYTKGTPHKRAGAQLTNLRVAEAKRWFDCEPVSFEAVAVLRRTKQQIEMKLLTQLRQDTLAIIEGVRAWLRPGVSEREVLIWIRDQAEAKGLTLAGEVEPIVAFGDHTAICHHMAGSLRLSTEMPVLLDLSLRSEGYHSDLTRSWWFGDKSPVQYRQDLRVVTQYFEEVLPALHEGAPLSQVASNYHARYLEIANQEPVHSLGHGVGLSIHELPHFHPKAQGNLLGDEVLAVEPGIYRPGKWGIRYEDMVRVKPEGAVVLESFD